MAYLDLNRHDPNEFEGKWISCQGCDYEIGARLDAGGGWVAHKLINRTSGLALHSLRVWLEPVQDQQSRQLRERLARVPGLRRLIPVPLEVCLAGGTAELHVHAGPCEEPGSLSHELMRKADCLLCSQEHAKAIALYHRVLRSNPHHTNALLGLAAAQAGSGDVYAAFMAAAKACSIEPNHLPYRQAYILYAAGMGSLRVALDGFVLTKTGFPGLHDLDDMGARLHLYCGEPEHAVHYLGPLRGIIDSGEHDRLQRDIAAALSAKTRSMRLMRQAERLVKSAQASGAGLGRLVAGGRRLLGLDPAGQVRDLLEQAHAAYDKDPILSMNLAFALRRCGEAARATELLVRAGLTAPAGLMGFCYANAAYCEIEAGNLSRAMTLLGSVVERVMAAAGEAAPSGRSELPGIGLWADPAYTLEEPLPSAARLIARAVDGYSRQQGRVPDGVVRLAALYRAAAAG